MYWVVLSGILLAESWTVFIIGWFPFYSWIRLFFLSYLVLPQTQGARILYQEYVEPFFSQNEQQIEELIGHAHERAKSLGLQYVGLIIDFVREKLLGLPPRPAATAASVPTASGPAAYAQGLLSRFNLPSVASSNLPSTGSDWYSMITSAVTAVTSTGRSQDAQAEELYASGILRSRDISSFSRENKARFYAAQRERLEVLVSALEKEEQNFSRGHHDDGDCDREDNDLAYGASHERLRKNVSENSFDHIHPEDIQGSLPSSASVSPPLTPKRSTSEGWTSGWFGGNRGSGGSGTKATRRSQHIEGRGEFATRAIDEISKATEIEE